MAWLDAMGVLSETADKVWDIAASREEPSLQLIGDDGHHSLDLGVLQSEGVRAVGRVVGIDQRQVTLATDLAASIEHAETKMHHLLDRVDRFIETRGLSGAFPETGRPSRVPVPEAPAMIDLKEADIRTVVWATGYRREYPWLHVPALDETGELLHQHGVTDIPGLYTLGLRFQRRRASHFIGGVGADAAFVARRIAARRGARSRGLLRHA